MKLSAFHLKVIALALMLIEHIGRYLRHLLPEHYSLYAEYTGRIVAPIFFFLAVESYFKTSNRRKYIARLYIWAIVMQMGNFIVGQAVQRLSQPKLFFPPAQNIFLTIAVGISLIAVLDWSRRQPTVKKIGGLLGAGVLAFVSLFLESSYIGLGLFLVFYFFYNQRTALYVAYAVFSLLFVVKGLMNIEYFWSFEVQWAMIAALPLIALYKGQRGRSMKYLFYLFYPLHIWILYALGYATGYGS